MQRHRLIDVNGLTNRRRPPNPHRFRALAPIMCLAVISCDDGPASQSGANNGARIGAGETIVRGDTVIRYVGVPRYPAGGTITHDLTIGLVDGPQEYVFGSVASVALGAGGHIYVLDRQAQIVREYDADGVWVRDVARGGEGPGELQDGYAMAVADDGRLYVTDLRGRMVHRYSADGEFETDYLFRPRDLGDKITVDTAGYLYLPMDDYHRRFTRLPSMLSVDTMPNAWGVSMSSITSIYTLRMAPDGAVRDSVEAPDLPDLSTYYVREETYTRGSRAGSTYLTRANMEIDYYAYSWWLWSPVGALVTGMTDTYAIDFHFRPRPTEVVGAGGPGAATVAGVPEPSISGDSIFSLRRRVAPIPLDPAERDLLREQRAFVERSGPAADSPGEWHGPDEPPAVKPAYHAAMIGQDGALWVLVPGTSERVPGSFSWREVDAGFDVFDPSGSYIGVITYPPEEFVPTTFRGDTALSIEWDEMGVQTVRRWVVRWGGG